MSTRLICLSTRKLDDSRYPTSVKVSDAELAGVRIRCSRFHGDWNYVILPYRKTP